MCDESYNAPNLDLPWLSNTTPTSSSTDSNVILKEEKLFPKHKLNKNLMTEEYKENIIEAHNINEACVEFKENFNKTILLPPKKRFRSNELNSLLEQHVRMSYLDL